MKDCENCEGTGKADGAPDSPKCPYCLCLVCGSAPCECISPEQFAELRQQHSEGAQKGGAVRNPYMKFSGYVVVKLHPGEIFTWVSSHPFKSEALEVASKGKDRLVVDGEIYAVRPMETKS